MFLAQGDVDLIREAAATMPASAVVVDLGAGSGTTACAVLAERPDATIHTVDHDEAALGSAHHNIVSAGLPDGRWRGILGNTAPVGRNSEGSIDLLIVDANHEYEGVAGDIIAWVPKLRSGAPVVFHDYDAHDAPELYPGVKLAVDEAVERGDLVFVERRGWSALCRKP